MKRTLVVSYLIVLLAVVVAPVETQEAGFPSEDGLWQPVEPSRALPRAGIPGGAPGPRPVRPNLMLFEMDAEILGRILARAPSEAARPAERGTVETILTLPMPDGSYEKFLIQETPVMAPQLAAKYPDIRTFRGQGVEDPAAQARLDITPTGFHAWVQSERGQTVIDPAGGAQALGLTNTYGVASRGDAGTRTGGSFDCLVEGRTPEAVASRAAEPKARAGHHLRTYRLAVAATAEYTAQAGGTKALALERIVTTINRVTGIYEREVGVRLQLVGDTDDLIFLDAATDPFANGNARVLINQSQSVIDDRIGDANYDIGHTFSTGAGGLAGLGVVTISGRKARGVTGRDNPFGDPFDVDYVAHEIGHQFGGDHTFNGTRESCSGSTRNAATAFEPGSGTTIQAYAGICSGDNIQENSNDYFHSISFDQIVR